MKSVYLLSGSVFSFVYVFAGIAFISGKLNFGFDANTRVLLGCAILLYGVFRIYMFYRKIRSARGDEKK